MGGGGAQGRGRGVVVLCKDDEMALVEIDKESTLFKAEWQGVLLIKKQTNKQC